LSFIFTVIAGAPWRCALTLDVDQGAVSCHG
jgi:hypothetical protein